MNLTKVTGNGKVVVVNASTSDGRGESAALGHFLGDEVDGARLAVGRGARLDSIADSVVSGEGGDAVEGFLGRHKGKLVLLALACAAVYWAVQSAIPALILGIFMLCMFKLFQADQRKNG